MKFKNIGYVVAAAALMMAQGAYAETAASGAKARADVKAETAAALKKGELPRGTETEGQGPTKATAKSTKTRAEVKAETAAAVKTGEVPKAGEGIETKAPMAKSTTTRAEVKAEVAAAKAKGEKPVGEGSTPPPATPPKK